MIAEHNQELADTLNARTFALAQSTGLAMMNICSTCQGAQSECQQRLDADSAYRAHINEALADEGIEYVKGKDGFNNKNFLWVLVEDYGLDEPEGAGERGRFPGCGWGRSTAVTSSARSSASATTSTPSATSISSA